jgi:hypothetical protein
MKLSKVLHFLAAIVVVIPIAVVTWLLSRPIPMIDPPLMAVDHRVFPGPQFEEMVYLAPAEWKREILSRFEENDLRNNPESSTEVYRLVFLPTFDPPVSVRVENRSGQYSVSVTKLSGQGGFGFDELGRRKPTTARFISNQDWLDLERLIEECRFWEVPTFDVHDVPVTDGAYWILEGENGLYHRVQRITPSPKLEAAMVKVLDLGGVKNDYPGYFVE